MRFPPFFPPFPLTTTVDNHDDHNDGDDGDHLGDTMSYNNEGFNSFSGSFSSSSFPFLDSQPQEMDASGQPAGHEGGHLQSRSDHHLSEQEQQNVFSDNVSFQIPHFIYSSAPNLATGGGVEVFPLGMPAQSWIANSGFRYQDSLSDNSLGKKPARDYDEDVFEFKVPKTHTRRPSLLDDYQHDLDAAAPSSSTSSRPRSQSTSSNSRLYEEPPIPDPARARIAAPLPPHSGSSGTTAASQTLGLPIYSATGFDLLSVLARIATRPNPRVPLGPVDMSCSFVVTDTRRHDHPIIYCSPNFLELTGYSEAEILGRNCRFLQSPCGISQGQRGAVLGPGDPRPDSSTASAAWHLKKSLDADKEVQVVITNYKKDGTPFTNHVTVIPVPGGVTGVVGEGGEDTDVVFQVGFQVDLTEQPSMILEKLKNGSYLVDYSTQNLFQGKNQAGGTLIGIGGLASIGGGPGGGGVGTRERRTTLIPKITISKQMKRLLNDPGFVRSIPITASMLNQAPPLPPSSSPAASTTAPTEPGDIYGGNHPLHFMLLETGPDFIHVVSLKGTFLYVAPSVRNVLGYEPEDLAGKSISDLAHPEDVVPLMRELKESSTTGISAAGAAAGSTAEGGPTSSSGASAAGSSPTISTAPNGSGERSATTTTSIASTLQVTSGHAPVQPRTVDLLFRARTKNGAYVWVESRGRLHVEPGKGRKAIILSGRAREIPKLNWGMVIKGGGLAKTVKRRVLVPAQRGQNVVGGKSNGAGAGSAERVEEVDVMQEFWGTVSPSMVLLMLGKGFEDVLGWNADDWKGRNMKRLLDESGGGGGGLESIIKSLSASLPSFDDDDEDVRMDEDEDEDDERGSRNQRSANKAKRKDLEAQLVQTQCRMRHKDGRLIDVIVNVFRCERDPKVVASTRKNPGGVTPAPLIVQVRLVGAEMYPLVDKTSTVNSGARDRAVPVDPEANMFEELEISRGSSWQYELQQLKYANQRLKEDIRVLEAAVGGSLPLASGNAGSSSIAAVSTAGPSQSPSSGMRSSYGGGNGEASHAQPLDSWSTSSSFFSSAPLPSRTSTAMASSSRGFVDSHHSSQDYEPPSPTFHDFSQHLQEQEQYLARQQAQHLSFQSPLHSSSTLHHPRQPSQSRPRTASTPISISTAAASLPSLTDWPSSAGLGPSPFVQRIQQEAMNNPGGVSVSVSVPVRGSNAASAGYQLLKRAWNGADGPASSR